DQVPERAIQSGLISRLGTIDPTDGGQIHRFGLTFNGWNESRLGSTRLTLYGVYSDLRLYSNFTFFLEDPVNGDQIFQKDRRVVTGGDLSHRWHWHWRDIDSGFKLGAQVRHDFIPKVALYHTNRRRIVDPVRIDQVNETSTGFYLENTTRWLEKLRTTAGLRGDIYWFDVEDRFISANSGENSDFLVSPKFGVVLGPWYETEFYFNYGFGFHSNDARGVTTRIDPVNGEALDTVDPLVRARGFEAGLRTYWLPGLTSTLALWQLKLDSELVFVGDAGTTEPSGKSKRYGIEWTNYYQPWPWLTLDFDLALTQAYFEDTDDDNIPNSVGRVVTGGATVDLPNGVFGSMRVRHFGAVPLNEQGTVDADSTTVVNLGLGWRWRDRLRVELNVLNLFDSPDSDISYFYASRLPGEPAEGVEDIHLHPVLPRQFRGTVQMFF
ncbi:MAG: TonB-dependent receptor, partial [Methylothermaceae bacterium]|nr:TonB-dependent receptor [Methylothermaceae bacterium]